MQISILSLFAISICIMVCVTQTAEFNLKGTDKNDFFKIICSVYVIVIVDACVYSVIFISTSFWRVY